MKAKKSHPYLTKSLFSLDLGSSKFVLGAFIPNSGKDHPRLETVAVPAQGFKKGQLVSLPEAQECLHGLISMAESQLGVAVDRVVVGIAGSHLQSRILQGSQALEGKPVTRETLRELQQQVRGMAAMEDREILHVTPCGFHLDGQRPVDNPCGLNGNVLHGDFLVIDGNVSYLKDIVSLCNQAGLEVCRLAATPFASAMVNCSPEARQMGCALLDMGSGVTDGVVFVAGKPRFLFSVAIGGQLMAQDLGIGLNMSFTEAERLKNHCGLLVGDKVQSIEVRDLRGVARMTGHHDVYPVLAPRVHELLAFLAKKLGPFQGALGAGLLLTGGSSELPGLVPFIERASNTIARHAVIELPLIRELETALDGDFTSHLLDDPHLSGVLGLLHVELENRADSLAMRQEAWHSRYIGQFANWLKELT